MYHFLIAALVTFILHAQPSLASWKAPLVGRHAVVPQRRQSCDEGNGISNQDQIISGACNANPQNDYWTCYNQLVVYIRQSAANTCALSYGTYNDCLVRNNSSAPACLDAKASWDECSNYAVDIYKYCACWYTMPADLYDCANVILEIRPKELTISTIPTSVILSTALLTGPILPASAASSASTAISITVVAFEPQPLQTAYVTSYLATVSPPPTIIRTLPVISNAVTTSKPPTTTIVSPTTRTLTTIITSCPPTITDCPRDYSSYSTYTSTFFQTSYSCDGGCDGVAAPRQACVRRKRVRLVKRGEL